MKVISRVAQVDSTKCTACRRCESHCPTEAIRVTKLEGTGGKANFLAIVEESKCVDCGLCVEFCEYNAVKMSPLSEPRTLKIDVLPEEMDQILEICRKAHLYPLDMLCPCTRTLVQEAVAVIIRGAKTPEELSLITGVRSGCGGIYCISRIIRVFVGAGIELHPPKSGAWVAPQVDIWNIPQEVIDANPLFRLEEDRKLYFKEHTMLSKEIAWGMKKEGN